MLYVHGAGHFHPENVIDNRFLESLDIGTSDRWIIDRVGIHARRTVLSLDYIQSTLNANPAMAAEACTYTNAQTGALAARQALDNASLSSGDIGLVIAGSCTPQFSCPAEACTIAAQLDIDTRAMDLNSACSSLAAQLYMLSLMRPDALPDYILLVNPDNSTPGIDYADRSSCVLWGDCSSALVVSASIPAPMKITKTIFTSQPGGWNKVQFMKHGHFRQDGRTVQTFAIKRSIAMLRELQSQRPTTATRPTKFIGHQANLTMLESVCRRAGVDPADHYYNVDQYGNCGAAGAPSVLSQNWERLEPGDTLVMSVVGSGLSWGGVFIQLDDDAQAERR